MHSTDSFADSIRSSGLLDAGQLQEFDVLLSGRDLSARRLAGKLLRRGWLTDFQIRTLWRGHGAGLVLGPYVLLDRLGRGGMGTVYKARHIRMGRLAALKVLRPDVARRPGARARFRREVRAAARANHPNVVHAYDAGEHRSLWYLAMEHVEGPDLGRLVADGPLEVGRACAFAHQAALGLQHLHERGVVHRDVKPSNLSLARGGSLVKVLDVGLAALEEFEAGESGAGLTQAGRGMGTLDYVSPEQLEDARRAGPRADQYGLGCTLYHLLAGRTPFPGGSPVEKVTRHLQTEPEPLEALVPELPPGLGDVVRRLMAKRPRDRFRSMREAAEELAAFATPLEAEPGSGVPLICRQAC